MGNIDDKNELFLEINKMYIVNVLEGNHTMRGSYIARSDDGQEFFAYKEFVKRNRELFELLSQRIKPLWALAKDCIWRGKWNNKLVSEVVTISENKKDCEDYKTLLFRRLQIRINLIKLHEQELKLIENYYGKPPFEEDRRKLKKEMSNLIDELSELDKKLDN